MRLQESLPIACDFFCSRANVASFISRCDDIVVFESHSCVASGKFLPHHCSELLHSRWQTEHGNNLPSSWSRLIQAFYVWSFLRVREVRWGFQFLLLGETEISVKMRSIQNTAIFVLYPLPWPLAFRPSLPLLSAQCLSRKR